MILSLTPFIRVYRFQFAIILRDTSRRIPKAYHLFIILPFKIPKGYSLMWSKPKGLISLAHYTTFHSCLQNFTEQNSKGISDIYTRQLSQRDVIRSSYFPLSCIQIKRNKDPKGHSIIQGNPKGTFDHTGH